MPNHYIGDLLLTIGISGLSRVRTELLHLTVVEALPPHPVQMHRQLSRHRYFRDLASAPHCRRWPDSGMRYQPTRHRSFLHFLAWEPTLFMESLHSTTNGQNV